TLIPESGDLVIDWALRDWIGGVRTPAARGGTAASHRGARGAALTRRDDRAYRPYMSEEQRSQRGCIAGRMQLAFHHGLLAAVALAGALGTIVSSQTESGDWPQWRGPNR